MNTSIWIVDTLLIKKNYLPAKIFVVISLSVGWLMSYSFPLATGNSWDDEIHYASSVNIIHEISPNNKIFQGDNYFAGRKHYIFHNNMYGEIYDDIVMLGDMVVDADNYVTTGTNSLVRISYIHVVATALLKRAIGLSFDKYVILSRFSNCILYSVVLYFGIKN